MRKGLISFAVVCCFSMSAAPVENFLLLDQHGAAHELYYYSDFDAVALIVQGNGCPIIRNALPDIKSVRDQFQDENVAFLMLNANPQDTRESILEESEEWEIDFPILVDETQLVARGLGITRTAEAFVINPKTWELVYRGPVNDRLGYERQKLEAEEHYVANAISSIRAGEAFDVEAQGAKGCLINMAEPETEISYVDDVAPILQARCMNCHVPGGIGPWAMTSYEMVRGFAPMMREVLRTNRMPPWHADPHIGEWSNDRGIPASEKKTLVDWIESGTPRGEGDDPLQKFAVVPTEEEAEWPSGEPDLIVDVPAYNVPASGVVDYQTYEIESNIEEGVWVRGIDVVPGDTNVVHHLLVGSMDAGSGSRGNVFDNYIGGYAPGTRGASYLPEGTGIYIQPGSKFAVQMHYTPYGKAVVDETKIGLYLHDEPPKSYLRHGVVIDYQLAIPPNTKAHEEGAYFKFEHDAELYTILPHSHYRGRSSTFEVEYPDGSREMLLSVPNYDFNWQTGYNFAESKIIPAGSRLIHKTVYDNSKQNFANPDPDRLVTWGLQSWDEMLYGDFVFRWIDETTENPIHSNERFRVTQMIGFMDKDMDGGIERDELGDNMLKRLEPAFQHFDANGDDALELDEFHAYQAFVAQRRAEAGRARGIDND